MEFPVRTGAPATQKTACCILPIFEGGALTGPAKQVDSASRGVIKKMLRSGDVTGKLGTVLLVPRTTTGTAAERWLLVGCGPRKDYSAKRMCRAVTAAVQALKGTGIKEATSYLACEPPEGVDAYYAARLSVEMARAAMYRFDELKSKPEPASKLARFALGIPDRAEMADTRRGVAHGQALANGMDLARDLANRPANVCTPAHLASTARELAKLHDSLKAEVLGEKEMEKLGMGALLSVTRGAGEPAQLIVLHYRGAGDAAPIVLCGKGITFDTGGISIKPAQKLDEMKFDMCGAASVLGTMAAISELAPEVNVTAIVPAAENMPDSRATRPGDIVTSMSGQTIEIINTDAEGRLVLCDAMTYAKRFGPRCIIDVATLTGACVIALGNLHTGLFSTDDALTASLLEAAGRSLDTAWRMPVDEEYFEPLKSNFADFANSGSREAGASVAAQFLSKFVDDGTPWAHLDIAGVSWKAQAEKGATGRPVPLLTDYILNSVERT
jgi:leucyl aminopeptidase